MLDCRACRVFVVMCCVFSAVVSVLMEFCRDLIGCVFFALCGCVLIVHYVVCFYFGRCFWFFFFLIIRRRPRSTTLSS